MSLPRVGVGKVQGGRRQGLSPQQIEAVARRQRGLCMMCDRPLGLVPTVDHDHELAKRHGHDPKRGCSRCFRFLLCNDCNLMIGFAKDKPATLRRAAALLTLWREEHPL